jgi:hypothetical protein
MSILILPDPLVSATLFLLPQAATRYATKDG